MTMDADTANPSTRTCPSSSDLWAAVSGQPVANFRGANSFRRPTHLMGTPRRDRSKAHDSDGAPGETLALALPRLSMKASTGSLAAVALRCCRCAWSCPERSLSNRCPDDLIKPRQQARPLALLNCHLSSKPPRASRAGSGSRLSLPALVRGGRPKPSRRSWMVA